MKLKSKLNCLFVGHDYSPKYKIVRVNDRHPYKIARKCKNCNVFLFTGCSHDSLKRAIKTCTEFNESFTISDSGEIFTFDKYGVAVKCYIFEEPKPYFKIVEEF
jgi:hypothetical protein